MNPVVSGARLFAEHGDLGIGKAGLGQGFKEFVAHHTVADNDDLHDISCNGRRTGLAGSQVLSAVTARRGGRAIDGKFTANLVGERQGVSRRPAPPLAKIVIAGFVSSFTNDPVSP